MRRQSRSDGFTVVEVVVASALLAVGVLGVLLLLDVGSTHTATAKARSAGSGLAHRVVEVARSVTLGELDQTRAPALIQAAAPDLQDSVGGDSAWTVDRDGGRYTVELTVCQVDDPADGTAAPSARTPDYCEQPAASSPADATPSDAKRVLVTVRWTVRGRAANAHASAQLPITLGDLPRVTAVSLSAPSACAADCAITTDVATARFAASTNTTPGGMTWLVDGAPAASCPDGGCAGSAQAWTFDWSLGTTARDAAGRCVAGSYRSDGTYSVGARASDAYGRALPPVAMLLKLNRCQPLAQPGVVATGRDTNTPVIDVEWNAGSAGDLAGYRVYKGPSAGALTPVCPADPSAGGVVRLEEARACVDPSPPAYTAGTPYYYAVAGVDRDAGGNLREGPLVLANVNTGNRPPNAPTAVQARHTTLGLQVSWSAPNTEDPDAGDRITGYRVYRRAGTVTGNPTHLDRVARDAAVTFCTGGCKWVDRSAPSPATYWVTSIDSRLRESAYSAPVTL